MQWRSLAAAVAGLALGAGLLVGTAPPSGAAVTIDPAARVAAEAAITVRLGDLKARVTLVQGTSWLSATDRSALLSELNSEISGLDALATTIQAETSVAAFRTEAAGILSQFRVYALVVPQVHLVRATDEVTTVILPDLQAAQTLLGQQIQLAGQQHKDTSATAALMSDLATQVTNLQAVTNGLSAKLLALTPAAWNTDHSVLIPLRQQLGSGRVDAGHALSDIKAVEAIVQ
jgi:hypothetical protein